MKNKEKYAKEIVEWAIDNYVFGISKENGKIVPCSGTSCEKCIFKEERRKRPWISCYTKRKQWANAEYKEPRQFTVQEKAFINLFPEIQYIARDKNNKIFGYYRKPFKDEEEGWWVYKGGGPDSVIEIRFWTLLKFESIQWEDEEPTSREEILRGSDE